MASEDKGSLGIFSDKFLTCLNVSDPYNESCEQFMLTSVTGGMTYTMIWPEDGVVTKADAIRVCDGSIFHEFTKGQIRYNGQGSKPTKVR